MSPAPSARPRFVAGAAGDLFVVEYQPGADARGTVIFAPPFAEEMNRARRMIALQARGLAADGWRVIIPDLYGTGDSLGDFSDARWELWISDLRAGLDACAAAAGPVWVWGLRLGALLALDAVRAGVLQPAGLVLWSPCVDGKTFMNQFLRLRLLAGMIAGAADRETIDQLRAILAGGSTLEVAGYELTPDLVASVDDLSLSLLATAVAGVPVHWFEMVASEGGRPAAVARRTADALTTAGTPVTLHTVAGPPFYSTPEITTAPALISATRAIVGRT